MSSTSALVSALRDLGDRPAVVADGRAISGIGLLLGVSPPGGLPRALAERVAAHAALAPAAARTAEARLRHWAGVLGPPPIRHTVLHPTTELAVELGLATLLAGGTVHCGDPEQQPDEQLAALAATGTTHLSLPSPLLWRLSGRPGLPGHDLRALRLILHVGPEPRQDDVYAAVDALGAVLAHVRAPQNEDENADHRLRADAEAAEAAAWKYTIGLTADQTRAFGAHLDRAVLTSLLLTLQQAGVLTDPAHGHHEAEILAAALVTPAENPRVRGWLDALTRHGLITRRGPLYHGAPALTAADAREAWRPATDAWADGLGPATALERVRRGATRLPRLITGEEPPRPYTAPLRWAAARGYLGAVLGALVRSSAEARAEAHDGPQPLRVLELDREGVETTVARALASRPRRHTEHHLAPDGGRYDLVVATTTAGPEEEASALVDLLAPGGRLLLLAPVAEHLDLLITGDARGAGAAPDQVWRTALARAGCPQVLGLPGAGHPMAPLGLGLFVARAE
ncbi:hypothetical protein [Streptomyces sp. NRRL WC-3742]|uniref:hypothetical protein n=1 Tax=Streptomyces sp. NRRL WC-3742 TaxID=1463934 RepID=UPI0004C6CDCE|nr:hypothetical protein [Streptomyces sp. NRRL WC-3742]